MNSTLSLAEKATAEHKQSLRRDMRAIRRRIPGEHRIQAYRAAAARLLDQPALHRAAVVALYAPIRSEVRPRDVAATLWETGKTVVYPRVHADESTLRFYRVDSLSELVKSGRYRLPTPPESAPHVPLDAIELFVVPGLAFDDDGYRLGWGRGYYDITLAASATAIKVGFCYEQQHLSRVPRTSNDVPMHLVVTDERVIHPTRHSAGAEPSN